MEYLIYIYSTLTAESLTVVLLGGKDSFQELHYLASLYCFPTPTNKFPSLTNSVATYKLQGWDTSGSLLCTCYPRSYFSLLTHAVRHRKVVYGFLWFPWSETFCLTVATHVLHVVLELIPSKRYTE